MSVGVAALAVLKREGKEFRALAERAAHSRDPEVVHDLRVACRRMRVALKDFEPYLPEWMVLLNPELKWMFTNLGRVRDLDVQIAGLKQMCPESHEKDLLLREMRSERSKAHGDLLSELSSERFSAVNAALRKIEQTTGKELPESAETPLACVAPQFLKSRYDAVQTRSKRVVPNAQFKEIHDYRKSSKQLRYSLEMTESIYGKRVKRALKRHFGGALER